MKKKPDIVRMGNLPMLHDLQRRVVTNGDLADAFLRGRAAFGLGDARDTCPYRDAPSERALRKQWLAGWDDGRQSERNATQGVPAPTTSPGPWEWRLSGTMGRWVLLDATGEHVKVGGSPDAPLSADQMLIATSPDLLAACQQAATDVAAFIENDHVSFTLEDASDLLGTLRAAIAKATA